MKKQKHVCKYDPPSRVWFPTRNGWASRPWKPGEREDYARRVLGQS